VARIVRDEPSRLPGMHRDPNALPSQTDRQTFTDIVASAPDVYITSRANDCFCNAEFQLLLLLLDLNKYSFFHVNLF